MAESKKRIPKLTVKQAKFVQAKAEGKSGVEAAMLAYDTTDYNTAAVIANENLNKPNIQQALAPIFAKHGINLDTAIAPIGKGLKATKMNEFTGEVTEDLKTQLAASDRALKLMGVKLDQDQPHQVNFIQIVEKQRDKYGI